MLAKRCLLISSAVTLCAGTLCAGMLCAGIASAQTTTSQVAVWDTRHPSADRLLAKDLLQRDGWGAIGRRQNAASFDGDAVMAVNSRSGGLGYDYRPSASGPSD